MKKQFFDNTPLVLALLLSIAVGATEAPLWMSLFSFMMVAWKYVNEKYDIRKIPVKFTPFFGVFIFVIVYLQYKTILGQEESTTILLGLVALSILNYETERDMLFLILLGFLILVIKSVFSLDFIWLLPALFSYFGLWFSMLTNKKVNKYKFLMRTTLHSVPILLVLFVLFPRLVIFQTKPANRVVVQSGFSDEDLNPGRFSEVAMSNQMVFRAEFKNNRMNTEELYWRGRVLSISKGFVWLRGSTEKSLNPSDKNESGIEYKVILEPMNLRNIFVLDRPIKISAASTPVIELASGTYVMSELQSQQVHFEGQAAFNSNVVDESDSTELQKYLFTPPLPPRSQALVDDIKAKNVSPKSRIEALKKFFIQKGFIYTLNPEFYKNNLDEFLFERKKGFCEHFAASFATLSRALGVPSRVVLGYQGGLYNSMGNFWKVSQKDAHAWVEVGLYGSWSRVDPTALVTPLRITLGGENYFSLSEDEQILFSMDRNWKKPESLQTTIRQVRFFFENLNYAWTLFLLNYDLQTQIEYLRKFQGNWLIGTFFILLFILFLIYNRNRRIRKLNFNHEAYDFFILIEKWAGQKGLIFKTNQTPLQILDEISKEYPVLKSALEKMSQHYTAVVYRGHHSDFKIHELKKEWKQVTATNNL